MYSQFCYYIQQDEQKRHATMHIPRKPSQQIEVDWAGDTASVIDCDTGEITKVHVFVATMSYSTYAYTEAFPDMKQASWIKAVCCIIKVPKVAEQKRRKLHLHFGERCSPLFQSPEAAL